MSIKNQNMFEVLSDSGSEDEKPVSKMTKKERRAHEATQRRNNATHVTRDRGGRNPHRERNYEKRDGKRTYERHSGTGRQAHGNYRKKSGHGKGNWGSEADAIEEGLHHDEPRLDEDGEPIEEEPEEPQIETITLDDYLEENNLDLGIPSDEEVDYDNVKLNEFSVKAKKKNKKGPKNKHGHDIASYIHAGNNDAFDIEGLDEPLGEPSDRRGRGRGRGRGGRGRGRGRRDDREGGDRPRGRGGRGRGRGRGGRGRGRGGARADGDRKPRGGRGGNRSNGVRAKDLASDELFPEL